MADAPFPQRFGITQSKLIDNDFPESARIGLTYLLMRLVSKKYILADEMYEEILRTGRLESDALYDDYPLFQQVSKKVKILPWHQVFMLCERAYLLLKSTQYFDDQDGTWLGETIDQVQGYYQQELNHLLSEENLAFRFDQGRFQRKGHAQTQKNIARAGSILGDPLLVNVRSHFNKSLKYFDAVQDTDYENSIKEAVCALEAMVAVLPTKSEDFGKAVKELQGDQRIPAPIVEVMIKLYAYRGSGQGVAHAAVNGNKVSKSEAELTLSMVAALITYLNDLIPREEIPF